MLPLINFTTADIFAADPSQGAGSLVPEGTDALQGEFVDILQSTVHPQVLTPTIAGELLPDSGNTLPPADRSVLTQASTDGEPVAVVDIAKLQLSVDAGTGIFVGDTPGLASRDLPPAAAPQADPAMKDTLLPPPSTDRSIIAATDLQILPADDLQNVPAGAVQAAAAPVTNALRDANAGFAGRNHDQNNDSPRLRQQQAISLTDTRTATLQADAGTGRETSLSMHLAGARDAQGLNAKAERARTDIPVPAVLPDTSTRRAVDVTSGLIRDDGLQPPRPAAAVQLQPVVLSADNLQLAEPGPRINGEFAIQVPRPPAAVTPQPSAPFIEVPVQQPGWDNALAERVTLLANGKLQHAEIRLTPAELGPLRIRVSIEEGAAHVSFQAQHAVTREAIEQAMPRLREMLAENGLSLGQAHVGDDSGHQKSRDARADAGSAATAAGGDVETDDHRAPERLARRADGLVDTFA